MTNRGDKSTALVPRSSAVHLQGADFCFTTTPVRLWQPIYLSNPRAHARMREIGTESNELCSLGKEKNESISNVWLQYWPELMLVWSLCYWLKANIFANVDTYREVRSILEDASIYSGPSTSVALNIWMISLFTSCSSPPCQLGFTD